MQSSSFNETFLNKADAVTWFERTIDEEVDAGRYIYEARLVLLNGLWYAGVTSGSKQLEMVFDTDTYSIWDNKDTGV